MSDDKVVPIKPLVPSETVVETLERVIGLMKASEGMDYKSGLIITLGTAGRLEYTPLGTNTDKIELLGMLQVTNQLVLDEMLGA